ncbi:MAG: metallophosphoesterase family protein [Anaerolineales bacterium]|nr:metallophosphoesterase family protein [Anaerolineales bacterium]
MKIAIFADIHSNIHALHAVLEDIERQRPDVVVCAGDMVGIPHPSGMAVWDTLCDRSIPILKGNHEEYVIKFHSPEPNDEIKHSVQFGPLQFVAGQYPTERTTQLEALPFSMHIDGPQGKDVFVCHGSPLGTSCSIAGEWNAELETALATQPETVIVGAHYHRRWHKHWNGKTLLLSGSGGLHLEGQLEAVYLLLTFTQGEWHYEHRALAYDFPAALHTYVESGILENGGPVSWLMLDEIMHQQPNLVPFFHSLNGKVLVEPEEWELAIRAFLEKTGRWEIIQPYLISRGLDV